ncbi:SDR family NAD(P)-dependent oxidoreductase [Streptomyces sp. NPDC001530]|uniref:SDR family NAD(P)-dependent oxidoreductase n=1 Tax=Streptomyces sp. NPDC001530 TaxID=3364582 RepID=UPI0036846F65
MADLTGKTALVTGASRGIGRAIAERLGSDGARVIVHYGRQETAAKETVAAIEAKDGQAIAVRAEFGTDEALDTLFTGLEAALAGKPLDILVNNAGIATGMEGSIDLVTEETFDRVFAVNVRAPLFVSKRALPLMRDGGRIINVSSPSSRIANPDLAYSMTKGAVDVLSRSLAYLVGSRGITVNSVAAGITETDITAWLRDNEPVRAALSSLTTLGRIGQPEDIADAVAFLASDDGRWVTGHVLDATGGFFLGPSMG